jgi:heme oxygenase
MAAERSRLMRVLMRGDMTRSAYCAKLRNLYSIYAALEPALARHAGHPQIAPIMLPGLARAASLESDLQALHGPDWRTELAPAKCTLLYVRRLHDIEATRPGLLLAHAYVRYLGDLSGGQMLGRIVTRSLGLADGAGTAFYDFGDAEQTRALTQAFRQGLDRITVDPAAADAIVDEAACSFRMHRQLFLELAHASGLVAHGLAARIAARASSMGAMLGED